MSEREPFDARQTQGRLRGRGSSINPINRFDKVGLTVDGEHLDELARENPKGRQIATQILHDTSRTIINHVDSPDIPFRWSINPYRGCEHGCPYCYARPTHENFGLSCGIDFETKIYAKHDAAKLLRSELSKPSWCGEPITMSGVTDPYQPIERELRITRQCLEVMAEFGQPVSIITKNRLVARDVDLLGKLASQNKARVYISLTSLDAKLSASMEPRASAPRDRLAAMRELSSAGVPVGVMTAPIVPGLTEQEIPSLLQAAAEAGATTAGYTLLRLPWQVEDIFEHWLRETRPHRADRVMNTLRAARGGKVFDARFHQRMRGSGAHADQISKLHKLMARRYGLDRSMPPMEHMTPDPKQGRLF